MESQGIVETEKAVYEWSFTDVKVFETKMQLEVEARGNHARVSMSMLQQPQMTTSPQKQSTSSTG